MSVISLYANKEICLKTRIQQNVRRMDQNPN